MNLNPQQKKAVNYRNGYGFVTAVPGSGKTRILTERTVALLREGVPPENILCITFTNKAANEMKKRIKNSIGSRAAKRLWISTFHSMGAKILRSEIAKVPHYDSNFTIIDADDQKSIIERGADELGYKVKTRNNKKGIDVREIISKISYKKDKLLTDDEFAEENDEITVQLFQFYKDYLLRSNCMDFGDLLYILYLLMKHKKSVLRKYSRRFQYIMVDECQDLNFCQYEIIKMLSQEHGNLVLIGDCDQSIYRFRQADPKHVQKYLSEKEVDLLPLSFNYRSTKKIVKCAESVIKNNKSRVSDNLETINEEGDYVKLIYFNHSMEEDKWVASEINKICNTGQYNYGDIAILYRTNATSRNFEQSLRMNHIPCKVIGGKSFFDLVVVKTCLNYLEFYNNPNNILAFHKIINKPRRSIATEMVNRIEKYCLDNKIHIIDALKNIDDLNIPSIGDKRKEQLSEFQRSMEKKPDDNSILEIAERIFKDSGLIDYIDELDSKYTKSDNLKGRSSPLDIYDSFMEMLQEWDKSENGSLDSFLEFINLQTTNDEVDNSDSVKLMTLHTSKGLEYPVVFIVGIEEGMIPHKFSIETGDPEDIEEERRLFYVGMTRAEKQLYLTSSLSRSFYRNTEKSKTSRFINEAKMSGSIISQRHESNEIYR
ncbi:MAG: ATP-dependent helicase [bacterium]